MKTYIPLVELLYALQESLDISTPRELKEAIEIIILAQSLTSGEQDTLRAAVDHGPLFDGSLPSKSSNTSLIEKGLMAKIVVKGSDGQNAATQKGYWANKICNLETVAQEQQDLAKIFNTERADK